MRTCLRISLALLMALAMSTVVSAQTMAERLSVHASVGPSFANLGTTLSTRAGLDFDLTDRLAVAGEFGLLSHAPFSDASIIAPPTAVAPARVNAWHWNGNLRVTPFERRRVTPYVTAGLGSFVADAVGDQATVNGVAIRDVRRVTDFATNVGAGFTYRVNNWVGLNGDYRTFFVHRDAVDPRVHRFSTGLSLFIR